MIPKNAIIYKTDDGVTAELLGIACDRSARLYQQNPDKWKRNATAWSKANMEKRCKICKENMRRQRVKLADAYQSSHEC